MPDQPGTCVLCTIQRTMCGTELSQHEQGPIQKHATDIWQPSVPRCRLALLGFANVVTCALVRARDVMLRNHELQQGLRMKSSLNVEGQRMCITTTFPTKLNRTLTRAGGYTEHLGLGAGAVQNHDVTVLIPIHPTLTVP